MSNKTENVKTPEFGGIKKAGKSNTTAQCNSCDWKGSKYEVLIGINAYFCPKCESVKIEFTPPLKKRSRDEAK